jgi:HEAT repeat protein
MISIFSRKIFWVLVFCLTIAMLGGSLFFYYLDKAIPNKGKEQSPSVKLQESLQVQTSRSNTEAENDEIQEKSTKSFKGVLGKQSGPTTKQPQEDSLDDITLPLESSDPMFAALIEQAIEDIMKDYEQQFAKTESNSEKTRAVFNEAFAHPGDETHKLMTLIRKVDEEEKAWIREELVKRFNSDPDPRIRGACLVCITMFRDVAREVLARALTSDSDRGVRRVAAYALGQTGSEQEIDALSQAVKEDKGVFGRGRDIAEVAITSLGEIGGEQAVLVLTKIWNNEDLSRGCREETLIALGMAGNPGSLEVFEDVLQGKEDLIRDNAAWGLGRLARKNQENPQVASKAIELLRNYVNDENPKVRRNVVDAIGWTGVSDDIDLLKPLLDDPYSITINYTEDGAVKVKTVYPVREEARRGIKRIQARLDR